MITGTKVGVELSIGSSVLSGTSVWLLSLSGTVVSFGFSVFGVSDVSGTFVGIGTTVAFGFVVGLCPLGTVGVSDVSGFFVVLVSFGISVIVGSIVDWFVLSGTIVVFWFFISKEIVVTLFALSIAFTVYLPFVKTEKVFLILLSFK